MSSEARDVSASYSVLTSFYVHRELGVEPLRNLDRLRIGPGVVTKTEGETHGWAAGQLWQGLVLLLVLLLVLDGERKTALSVPLHVVMQGLSL